MPVSHSLHSWPCPSCGAGAEAWARSWCWVPQKLLGSRAQPSSRCQGSSISHREGGEGGRGSCCSIPTVCPRHPAPHHTLPPITSCPTDPALHSGVSQSVRTRERLCSSCGCRHKTKLRFFLLMCALVLRVWVCVLSFLPSSLDPQSLSSQTSTCLEDFQHSQCHPLQRL